MSCFKIFLNVFFIQIDLTNSIHIYLYAFYNIHRFKAALQKCMNPHYNLEGSVMHFKNVHIQITQ